MAAICQHILFKNERLAVQFPFAKRGKNMSGRYVGVLPFATRC